MLRLRTRNFLSEKVWMQRLGSQELSVLEQRIGVGGRHLTGASVSGQGILAQMVADDN